MVTRSVIYINLLLSGYFVSSINGLTDNLFPDPDNELLEYMQCASFDMNYYSPHHAYRATNSSEIVNNFKYGNFNNIFIEYEGSEITLTNLQVSGEPNARLAKSTPNMMYGYLDTTLEWNTVIVDGKYEVYEKSGSYDSTSSKGELRLIWINTKAGGRIAFRPMEPGDGFVSTTYDLDFTGDTFQIIVINGERSKRSSEILQAASKQIKSRMEKHVQWKLQYNLRESVDRILKNRSMKQIFSNNEEMVKKYRTFIQENEAAANKFVDDILSKLQLGLNETGFWELSLPDSSRNFTRNLGTITVVGSLSLSNVTAQTISAVRRKSNFSLIRKDTIEFIGFLEFMNLTAHLKRFNAKIWNIENSGEVLSTVIEGSMFIKFIVIEDDKSSVKYKLAGYELVVYVNDVHVTVQGLSFLLSWMNPLIETTASSYLQLNVASKIDENMKQVLDLTIQKLSG